MSSKKSQSPDFLQELGRELKDVWQGVVQGWQQSMVNLRNMVRQARSADLDYVVITVSGSLPERDAPPRSFIQRQLPLPPEPLTLQTLHARLQRIAEAPDVKGVVFIFHQLEASLATLQSFRRAVQRLQNAGKEAIVFCSNLDVPHYYAASVADKLIVPPSSQFQVMGLYNASTFLKDTLARIGVEMDVVAISPYKSAMDQLNKSDMSPELREQLTWLMTEQYDQLTAGMAEGRKLSQEEMKRLIDNAPYYEEAMVEHQLVDAIVYEDEVPALLGTPDKPAKLMLWDEAEPFLMEKYRPVHHKAIGVVSLEGMIVMGASRRPPIDLPIPLVGSANAGEETLVQTLRQAAQNEQLAALIFHVDSPGGSALASDLIMREVQQIAQEKPVLVYMGNVAASGGYYVSTPAHHIMTQPGTITGSIGVVTGRSNTVGLLQKIEAHSVPLQQGARAGLLSRNAPLSEEERQLFVEGIQSVYKQFKQLVANGRNLPYDELDSLCEGRVWMGSQARKHQLVDSHGDFVDAIEQIAGMASLPFATHRIPITNVYASEKEELLAQPTKVAEEVKYLLTGQWLQTYFNGQPMFLLPFDYKFW